MIESTDKEMRAIMHPSKMRLALSPRSALEIISKMRCFINMLTLHKEHDTDGIQRFIVSRSLFRDCDHVEHGKKESDRQELKVPVNNSEMEQEAHRLLKIAYHTAMRMTMTKRKTGPWTLNGLWRNR